MSLVPQKLEDALKGILAIPDPDASKPNHDETKRKKDPPTDEERAGSSAVLHPFPPLASPVPPTNRRGSPVSKPSPQHPDLMGGPPLSARVAYEEWQAHRYAGEPTTQTGR